MKTNEKDAILGYLEFNLLKFVEESEKHVADPDVVGDMYDRAYSILKDFEITIEAQMLIDEIDALRPKTKRDSSWLLISI